MNPIMKHKLFDFRVVPALALSLALCGCGTNADDKTDAGTSPSASSSSSTPSASPSVSPTETAGERQARLAAETVIKFWALKDELGADPTRSLTELSTVSRAQALKQWQRNLNVMRGSKLKQVGPAVVTTKPGIFDSKSNLYTVTACIDVTKVNVVDSAGKSKVPADRPPRTSYDYKVQKDGDKYFVVEDLLEGKPC